MVLLVSMLAASCAAGDGADAPGERPLAVATISIVADFVEAVAGDAVEVRTIVPIGGDPHVHEPTPSDARLIARADVVFRNGLGLAPQVDTLIEAQASDRPVVTLTDGLDPIIEEEGELTGEPDPHMWMDPLLAVHYVERVRDALTDRFPEHREAFSRNADDYLVELRELDEWIAAQMATIPPENRKLVTTHDAFAYLGRRYGLEIVGTIWEISTEREPSAEEIRVLIDAVRERGVPTVFIETTINPRIMERVAADAGAEIGEPLYGDSVGEPGSGAETYIGMMRANTRAIVIGLGGSGGREGAERSSSAGLSSLVMGTGRGVERKPPGLNRGRVDS